MQKLLYASHILKPNPQFNKTTSFFLTTFPVKNTSVLSSSFYSFARCKNPRSAHFPKCKSVRFISADYTKQFGPRDSKNGAKKGAPIREENNAPQKAPGHHCAAACNYRLLSRSLALSRETCYTLFSNQCRISRGWPLVVIRLARGAISFSPRSSTPTNDEDVGDGGAAAGPT